MTRTTPLRIRERAGVALRLGHALPSQIFASAYSNFGFLEDVVRAGREFWSFLVRLGEWSHDDCVGVISCEPDYVVKTAGRDGAFEITLGASAEQYHGELDRNFRCGQYDPDLLTADALGWVPPSLDWAISYAREFSTIIIGFRRTPACGFPALAEASGLRTWSLEEILDLTKLDFGFYDCEPQLTRPGAKESWNAYAAEFRRNYGARASAGHESAKTDE